MSLRVPKPYHSAAGAPLASEKIRAALPFHQLAFYSHQLAIRYCPDLVSLTLGPGRCLNGEKCLGYSMTFQKAHTEKHNVQIWKNVPMKLGWEKIRMSGL